MKIAKVYINETNAHTISCKDIPKGILGGTVELEYARGIWDDLIKTVVFTNGNQVVAVADAGELVEIPAEVVTTQGAMVRMGVCGVGVEGQTVIPTLWADLRRVSDAVPVDAMPGADPSLPVWAQMMRLIGDPDQLTTQEKESLVAAVNWLHEGFGDMIIYLANVDGRIGFLHDLTTEEKENLVAAVNELAARMLSCRFLRSGDVLDLLTRNGRYCCIDDGNLIKTLAEGAGIPVPECVEDSDIKACGLFADVTEGDPTQMAAGCRAAQHVTVCYKRYVTDSQGIIDTGEHWAYQFDRVKKPDNTWSEWIPGNTEPEKENFVATYGKTTLEEIRDANRKGKMCFARYGDIVLSQMVTGDYGVATFTAADEKATMVAYVTSGGWRLERVSSVKTTEVTETSTNDQTPTAKAVWDLVCKMGTGGLDGVAAIEDLALTGIVDPVGDGSDGVFVDENDCVYIF